MRPQEQVSRQKLSRWWSLVIRGAIGLAVINVMVAIVVRVAGGSLHPLFADPSAWLVFLVSSLSLLGQAGLMRMMQLALLRNGSAPRPRKMRAVAGLTTRCHARHAGRRRRVGVLDSRGGARAMLRGM